MKRRFYLTRDYLAALADSDAADWAVYDRERQAVMGLLQPVAVFASRTHAREWAKYMNERYEMRGKK